jgi:hypothetical protein
LPTKLEEEVSEYHKILVVEPHKVHQNLAQEVLAHVSD